MINNNNTNNNDNATNHSNDNNDTSTDNHTHTKTNIHTWHVTFQTDKHNQTMTTISKRPRALREPPAPAGVPEGRG